jgi:hypothetical protein
MVQPAILFGVFQRQNILGLFHNADFGSVTLVIAADGANLSLRYIETSGAQPGLLFYRENGFGKQLSLVFVSAQQVEGDTLGALGPDAGQFVEFLDKFGYGFDGWCQFLGQIHLPSK